MKDLYGRMFAETVKHYVDTYKINSSIISEALIKLGDTEISRMFFECFSYPGDSSARADA